MSSNLWKHQKEAINQAAGRPYFALFHSVGTGKTRTQIEVLRYVYNVHRSILRTLIFAPLSVCPQWKTQFGVYSKIPQEKIHVLTQAGKKRTELIGKIEEGIVVTNYEAVGIESFYKALLEWSPEVLVCDESHLLKESSTQRHKKILPIAEKCDFRYLMTGTPILNSPMDLFGQYRILDLGNAFGKNFFIFRKQYCMDKNAGMPKQRYFPKWVVKPESEKVFSKVMAATSSQAKKEDCLDLPPLLKITHPVSLGEDQARLYKAMKQEYIAMLDGVVATAEFAMTKSLRLQQILCGFLQDADGEVKWVKDNPRLRALSERLESIGNEKVIIWTVFKPTYAKIAKVCEDLGRSYVFMTGEQSAREKQENIEAFTKGDVQTFIANPASGGTGLNLQEAPYAIYFARNFNLSHYLQSEARNYRGGSEMHEKITHDHFVAENTIDEVILTALEKKQSIGDTLLKWARDQKKNLDVAVDDIMG